MKQLVRSLSNVVSKLRKINVGDEVTVTRTITKEDVDTFALLSGDTNPIHSTGQETSVVHGAFLNAIVSSVIGTQLPGPGTLVVQQNLNFPNKCYVGETVKVTVKIVDNRKIIKVDFNCDISDKNKIVLYGSAKLMMNK